MTTPNTTVIEVNGVKLEVDLRQAKRVDLFQVGTPVKLLQKQAIYGSNDVKVHTGVVAGFEPFADLPTIIVAYLEIDYSSADVKFAYINAKSSDKWDIVASIDDHLPVEKASVVAKLDRAIAKAEAELADLQRKKEYFTENFGAYFAKDLQEA